MTQPQTTLVAFLTSDLVFPSRVAPVVQRLGAQFFAVGHAQTLLTKIEAAAIQRVIVLLDLSSPVVDPGAVVPQLRALSTPSAFIIAFGPHVHAARLAAAEAAGCDLALTRGQFDAQIDTLLANIIGDVEQAD